MGGVCYPVGLLGKDRSNPYLRCIHLNHKLLVVERARIGAVVKRVLSL